MNTYDYMLQAYGLKKHIFQSYSRAESYSRADTYNGDEGKKPFYVSDDGKVVITYFEYGYKVVTSGSTCKRITSKAECEQASIDLDLPDK